MTISGKGTSKSDGKKGTITSVITDDPSTVPSNKLLRDTSYFLSNIPGRYSYYTPSSEPKLTIVDGVKYLNYGSLTVVDLFVGSRVICSFTNKSVRIPVTAEALVYIKLNPASGNATGVYYHAFSNTADVNTEENLQIASANDFASVLPIAFVGRGANSSFTDLLLIGSSVTKSMQGVLTSTFNSRIDSLSIPFKSPLENTTAKGNTVNTVISKTIYERYDKIYLKTMHHCEAGALSYWLRIVDPAQSNSILFDFGFTNEADAEKEITIPFNDVDWTNVDKGLQLRLYAVKAGVNVPVTLIVTDSVLYREVAKDLHNVPMLSLREAQDMTRDANFITKRICAAGSEVSLGTAVEVGNLNFTNNGYSKYESIITLSNGLEAPFDGYVDNITVNVASPGKYRIYVGLLDQRKRFISSLIREVAIPKAGEQVLENLMLPISKGEQIGISELNSDLQAGVRYAILTAESDVQMLYANSHEGTLSKLSTTYGALITLKYDLLPLDSIFARAGKVDELEALVNQQRELISSLQFVTDAEGQKYRLRVVDGQVMAKNTAYKKVLALGNSLTSHYTAESSLGYYGDDGWAMASTNKELTSWTGFLKKILEQKQEDVTVYPRSIYNFEVNMLGADLDTLFSSYLSLDIDLIVLRFGENAAHKDTDYDGTVRIIEYLQEKFPLADIVITSMFWHDSGKELAFQRAAAAKNCQYVPFGSIADRCLLGQMLMGYDGILHPITHNGVAAHCTDVCFFDFANILAAALGYEQIVGKHTVTVNSSKEYGLNSTDQIHGGYVTVLTYESDSPSITAKTVSGDTVPVQIFNLSDTVWLNTPSKIPTYAAVFQMPDEDVRVSF